MAKLLSSFGMVCAALFLEGCTGGQLVDAAGNPVAGAISVEIQTCRNGFTTTAQEGMFFFNPYDPSSSAFDDSQYVTEGAVLVLIGGTHFYTFDHQFTRTCQIPWNNQSDGWLPCSHDVFFYDSPNVPPPAAGPNGGTVRAPTYIAGQCAVFDSACNNNDRVRRLLVRRHFASKCSLSNTL